MRVATVSLLVGSILAGCGGMEYALLLLPQKDKTDTNTSTATATSTNSATGAATATATGADTATESDDKADLPEILRDKVLMEFAGESVYIEDKVYELDCRSTWMVFVQDAEHPDCAAVETKTELDFEADVKRWTIKSATGSFDKAFTQALDEERLRTSNGDVYFCYFYDGPVYNSAGDSSTLGHHVVLSKKGMTRSSEHDGEETLAIFPAYDDYCEMLGK